MWRYKGRENTGGFEKRFKRGRRNFERGSNAFGTRFSFEPVPNLFSNLPGGVFEPPQEIENYVLCRTPKLFLFFFLFFLFQKSLCALDIGGATIHSKNDV